MAPGRVGDSREASPVNSTLPTLYLLDKFHPGAIKYCQQHFNTIAPGDSEHANWRNAKYLLIRSSYFTANDVASCPNLKAIGKQGVGIDKIDAEACAKRGIKIFNTPGVNSRAVAELVLALTMAVAREIPRIHATQLNGTLVPKETCSGLLLHRKTVGVLGMGNIGESVARIFHGGFETELIAYDPYMPKTAWADLPHTRAETVEEVLRACDVLTIHVPLVPSTRGLISYKELTIMKPTAILINAARGGIVDEKDLERGLREGLIWGAGLDCHEEEPPSKERYGALWEQRVVSTPHIGAATGQTQMETAIAAAKQVLEFAQAEDSKA